MAKLKTRRKAGFALGDRVQKRGIKPVQTGTIVRLGMDCALVAYDGGDKAWVRWDKIVRLPAGITPAVPAHRVTYANSTPLAKPEPQRRRLALQAGWLVQHDDFGWGEILEATRTDLLIGFNCGEKILNYDAVQMHTTAYEARPKSGDPRLYRGRRIWHCSDSEQDPADIRPRWSEYRFGRPNTPFWRR